MRNVLVVVLCLFASVAAWVGYDLGRKKNDISYKIGAMLPCLFLATTATWIGRTSKRPKKKPKQRRERDDWDDDDSDYENSRRRRNRRSGNDN